MKYADGSTPTPGDVVRLDPAQLAMPEGAERHIGTVVSRGVTHDGKPVVAVRWHLPCRRTGVIVYTNTLPHDLIREPKETTMLGEPERDALDLLSAAIVAQQAALLHLVGRMDAGPARDSLSKRAELVGVDGAIALQSLRRLLSAYVAKTPPTTPPPAST